MLVASVSLWFAETNCYVVAPDTGGPAVVIDAPPDVAGVGELLRTHDLWPAALLLTHGHVDHVGAAGGLVTEHSLAAYLHPDDEWLATDPWAQLRMLMGGATPPGDYEQPERYESLAHGEVLDLAGIGFEVIHTPGHTPGHCCFRVEAEGVLFSGDQLFAGSIGRTDLPGGDHDQLMTSMRERIVTLPGETAVFPGHGPGTTVATELANNPFLVGLG